MGAFVAYFRLSTDKQGHSGLGLKAQHKAVTDYVHVLPSAVIAAEFMEVETGKRADRPQLAKAWTSAAGPRPPWSSPKWTASPATPSSCSRSWRP